MKTVCSKIIFVYKHMLLELWFSGSILIVMSEYGQIGWSVPFCDCFFFPSYKSGRRMLLIQKCKQTWSWILDTIKKFYLEHNTETAV